MLKAIGAVILSLVLIATSYGIGTIGKRRDENIINTVKKVETL